MAIQRIKMVGSALWVVMALVIALTVPLSRMGSLLLATFGLLPPLFILLWWNDPKQTMSESINEARR